MKTKTQDTVLQYSAIFEPIDGGGYNVSFPAVPGCVTFGSNLKEAKQKAQEVLELWLEELVEDGQDIPVYKTRPLIDEVSAVLPKNTKKYAPLVC